jgi:glycosyltransferase involved in cell wall biosynthesis
MPLVIAGIVHDQGYFDTAIAPNIDGKQVRFIGPVGAEERSRLLGEAQALLHLIDFDEPFGLSVVEAMACGTPVVAFRRGSMPELIDDGITGAIVDDIESAVRAFDRVNGLDRDAIRATAVRRFSRERMVSDYLAVYEQVLSRRVSSRGPWPAR